MKLYTEEQMLKVWKAGQKYLETSGASITFEELLEHETSIKLPSDEEIDTLAYSTYTDFYADSFITGAKWMRKQILNQNK